MLQGSSRRAAQAIDALRHGWAITCVGDHGQLILLPVETGWIDPALRPLPPRLLISAARAATLKLANQRAAATPQAPVLIRGAQPLSPEMARAVADPALDLAYPLKGPFSAEALGDAGDAAVLAMSLARLAGLLPAFWLLDGHGDITGSSDDPAITVSPKDLAAYAAPQSLTIQSRAQLPVAACEAAQIVAFRARDDGREHIALLLGEPDGDAPPLVRLHSECLTGDVLGSLKCDCGPQLQQALALMAKGPGWGILLYLRQEGRGIGLINKLRAYGLQDQGFDTVDANTRLGLPAEARDFGTAAQMLTLLGVDRLRLLTNNPDKVAALEAEGLSVIERVPHALPANPHNARYLATKRDRSGHKL